MKPDLLRRLAGVLALTATLAASAGAAPDAGPAELHPLPGASWRQWGSGEMRWFGLRLYGATLWVAGASPAEAPHALLLHYRRDISRRQLVAASVDEMRRLGSGEAALKRWEPELARVFPDVRAGERIVGLHLPGVGARFFHQGQLTGEVLDPGFARDFFAIWLAPRTRAPDVRARLLTPPDGAGG